VNCWAGGLLWQNDSWQALPFLFLLLGVPSTASSARNLPLFSEFSRCNMQVLHLSSAFLAASTGA
jgi:hypothetical protein